MLTTEKAAREFFRLKQQVINQGIDIDSEFEKIQKKESILPRRLRDAICIMKASKDMKAARSAEVTNGEKEATDSLPAQETSPDGEVRQDSMPETL
jgi:hypothetical protein